MKSKLVVAFFLICLSACQSKEASQLEVVLKVGDCLDQALSPYVLQIAAIEGETIFYYHMGEMGKKIYQTPKLELLTGKAPFKKSVCP